MNRYSCFIRGLFSIDSFARENLKSPFDNFSSFRPRLDFVTLWKFWNLRRKARNILCILQRYCNYDIFVSRTADNCFDLKSQRYSLDIHTHRLIHRRNISKRALWPIKECILYKKKKKREREREKQNLRYQRRTPKKDISLSYQRQTRVGVKFICMADLAFRRTGQSNGKYRFLWQTKRLIARRFNRIGMRSVKKKYTINGFPAGV